MICFCHEILQIFDLDISFYRGILWILDLEDLFCHEILQIFDLDISFYRGILWILDLEDLFLP